MKFIKIYTKGSPSSMTQELVKFINIENVAELTQSLGGDGSCWIQFQGGNTDKWFHFKSKETWNQAMELIEDFIKDGSKNLLDLTSLQDMENLEK